MRDRAARPTPARSPSGTGMAVVGRELRRPVARHLAPCRRGRAAAAASARSRAGSHARARCPGKPSGNSLSSVSRRTKSQYSSRITCMSAMPSRRSSRRPRSTPSTAGQQFSKWPFSDDEPPHAVMAEAADDVAHDQREGVGVEARGARKGLAAARARLRLVAVGDGRGDEAADLARHALADRGRQHDVDVHRHVRAVLLGRAERQERPARRPRPARCELRPAQLGHEDAVGHLNAPSHLRTSQRRRSTLMHWPVMKLAPGPARKTIAAATSSGRPMRPSGLSSSLASVSRRGHLVEAQQRRVDRPGRDGVDQDVRREFARPGAGQRQDRRPWWRSRPSSCSRPR